MFRPLSNLFGGNKFEPTEFELLVRVKDYENLELDKKVLDWFCQSDDVTKSKGDIAFISVVGDQGSGKTTLLNHLHCYLKHLEAGTGFEYPDVFPTKEKRCTSHLTTNSGVLLRTTPYSILREDCTTVKVYLLDIWGCPAKPLSASLYNKMVDFCTAVSSIVYYSVLGRPDGATMLHRVNYEKSILSKLSEKIFQNAVYCFFNWPYETRSSDEVNCPHDDSLVPPKWLYKYGRVEEAELETWELSGLPVTSEIIGPFLEGSSKFQRKCVYLGEKSLTSDNRSAFLRTVIIETVKAEELKPISGEKGYRQVSCVRNLMQEAIKCANNVHFTGDNQAFMLKNNKPRVSQPACHYQSYQDNTEVKQRLRRQYHASLANLTEKYRNRTDELLFPDEELFDLHPRAAKNAILEVVKAYGSSSVEGHAKKIATWLNEALREVMKPKVQIELGIQNLMLNVILWYTSRSDSRDVHMKIHTHEERFTDKMKSLPQAFRNAAEQYVMAKLQATAATYKYLQGFEERCSKILRNHLYVEAHDFSALLAKAKHTTRQEQKLFRSDPLMESFAKNSEASIEARFMEEFRNRRQREILNAEMRAEEARRFYKQKMDSRCDQMTLTEDLLGEYHREMKNQVLQTFSGVSPTTSPITKDQLKKLKGQLDHDFENYRSENRKGLDKMTLRWSAVSKEVMNVYQKSMSMLTSPYSKTTKRQYFDVRDEAIALFHRLVLNDPIVFKKLWEEQLLDDMEREYEAGNAVNAVQGPIKLTAGARGSTESNLKVGTSPGSTNSTNETGSSQDTVAIANKRASIDNVDCKEGSHKKLAANFDQIEQMKIDRDRHPTLTNAFTPTNRNPQPEEISMETDELDLRQQLMHLIDETRQKLQNSSATKQMKKKVSKLVDAAAKLLSEADASTAMIKQSVDQLNMWQVKLK